MVKKRTWEFWLNIALVIFSAIVCISNIFYANWFLVGMGAYFTLLYINESLNKFYFKIKVEKPTTGNAEIYSVGDHLFVGTQKEAQLFSHLYLDDADVKFHKAAQIFNND